MPTKPERPPAPERPTWRIINNVDTLPAVENITFEESESLCRRCGTSCHSNLILDDKSIVIEDLHCKYMTQDGKKYTCSVYETRHEVPWCFNLNDSLKYGAMGEDCPYVEGVKYNGKTRLSPEEWDEKFADIMDLVRSTAWEPWWSFDKFTAMLERRTPNLTWKFVKRDQGDYWLEHEVRPKDD